MATFKQKAAFKEVLNGSTISGAMVNAGYSETTASTTGKLTNTKGWKDLMKQHLPDSALAKRHRQLLNKNDKDSDEPETQAVSKALDMAYRIKGMYADDRVEGNKTLIVMVTGSTAKRYGINSDTGHSSPGLTQV